MILNKKFEIEISVRDTSSEEKITHSVNLKKLQDYSWEEIANIKNPSEVFEIGDEKTITLKNGDTLLIAIAGFNHDSDDKGNILPITFTSVDLFSDRHPMNNTDTNKSGWKGCKMRKETMKNIFDLFPDDLQAIIKNTCKGETTDPLFLFNEVEVFGKTIYSEDNFGKQYDYYKVKHNKNKYMNDEEYSSGWWLRSPRASTSATFCSVYRSGNAIGGSASSSRGVAFGFCI